MNHRLRKLLSVSLAELGIGESRSESDRLWSSLFQYQREAVLFLEAAFARFGGGILADAVGLGKTWVALSVLARAQRRGQGAVAFVPAPLKTMWRRMAERWEIDVRVHGHGVLAHREFQPDRWSDRSLLVVDEAHHFRNPKTRRYPHLARLAAGRRLLLLTATPINNSLGDLAALIELFLGARAREELGVPDVREALEGSAGTEPAWLGSMVLRRGRRELPVERGRRSFPERSVSAIDYSLEDTWGGRLGEHLELFERSPELFLPGFESRGGELLSLFLARRFESSRAAFLASLERQKKYLTRLGEALSLGRRLTRRAHRRLFPGREGPEQGVFLEVLLGELRGCDAESLEGPLRFVQAWIDLVRAAPSTSAKLSALLSRMQTWSSGERVVLFTEFRDTSIWLEQVLMKLPDRVVARLDPRTARVMGRRTTREEVLCRFAPFAQAANVRRGERIDILISTDLLSEGTNLQDAKHVVSWDLPWNPVRLEQRIGRIDRLGSRHERIFGWTLRPSDGDILSPVLSALERKRALARLALGAELTVLPGEVATGGDRFGRQPGPSSLWRLAREVAGSERPVQRPPPLLLSVTGIPSAGRGSFFCFRPSSGRASAWRFVDARKRVWRDPEWIAAHLLKWVAKGESGGKPGATFHRDWERCHEPRPSSPGIRGMSPPRAALRATLEERLVGCQLLGDQDRSRELGTRLDRLRWPQSIGVELLLDDLVHRAGDVEEEALLRELDRLLEVASEGEGAPGGKELLVGLSLV
ncbi:MAG: helicase-related protein [Planctomycetota bacterium]